MNKPEILRAISKKTNFTLENCEIAYNALLEVMREAMLSDEDKIMMLGFGTFNRKVRAARDARHVRTKEIVHIPESVTYTFKLSPTVRDELNNK
jgi:nucleoid DNA-binding protein